jgi:hypothetical protein
MDAHGKTQGGLYMRTFKIAALVIGLVLGVGAQAQDSEALSDEAVLLFNGNETDLQGDELDLFNSMDENAVNSVEPFARLRIRCSSSYVGTRYCRVPGRVQHVRLIRQLSFLPCVAGRTFGSFNRGVWVRRGCSGLFTVIYNPRYRRY